MLNEVLLDEAITERADGVEIYVFDMNNRDIFTFDEFMAGVRFLADYHAEEEEGPFEESGDADPQEEEPEEEEPAPEPEMKEKKKPGRKPVDVGRIKALYNTGKWSYEQIADDLGVSTSTVYRKILELRENGEIE